MATLPPYTFLKPMKPSLAITPEQYRLVKGMPPTMGRTLPVTPEVLRAVQTAAPAAEPQKAGMPKWFPFVLGGAALVVIGALAMRRKPRVEVLPPRAKPELPSP